MKVSVDTKSESQMPGVSHAWAHKSITNRNFPKRDAEPTAILSIVTTIQYTFIDIKRCHCSLRFSTPKKYDDDDDDEICIRILGILNFVSFLNFSSIYFSSFSSILTAIKRCSAIEGREGKNIRSENFRS